MIGYLVAGMLAGAAVWMWAGKPVAVDRPSSPRQRASTPGAPREPAPLVLEMCATLLEAGLPVRAVLEIVGEHVPGYGQLTGVARALELNVEWNRAWSQVAEGPRELEPALRFTQLSGAPAARLLRASAVSGRKHAVRQAEARGAEFGIRLVIPLGLCALPAFVCLGVIPIVISLLPRF